jgi:hypothetical protein
MNTSFEKAEQLHDQRRDDIGFGGLLEFEKQHVAILSMMMDVMNGGAHQFIFNSSGDLANYAKEGLKAIRAKKTLRLVEKVLSMIPGGYCEDRKQRQTRLLKLKVDDFDSISRHLHECPEDVVQMSLTRSVKEYRAAGLMK